MEAHRSHFPFTHINVFLRFLPPPWAEACQHHEKFDPLQLSPLPRIGSDSPGKDQLPQGLLGEAMMDGVRLRVT